MSAVKSAAFYLDSTAVVKRYIQEPGTAWIRSIVQPSRQNLLFLARLSLVEVVAGIMIRERSGSISSTAATMALADYRLDFENAYLPVSISPAIIDHAAELIRNHGLRSYTGVQLAAALEVRSWIPNLVLLSSDQELNQAALVEGIPVDDPGFHP